MSGDVHGIVIHDVAAVQLAYSVQVTQHLTMHPELPGQSRKAPACTRGDAQFGMRCTGYLVCFLIDQG
jgi:hypothetical protein